MKKADNVSKKPIETVKKAVSATASVIMILICVMALWLLVDKFIIGSYAPRLFGYSALNVASGSMQDEIMVNDLVIIKRTKDYEVDDIITYMREGESIPTTHRIVEITSDGKYVTKGDANNTNDRFPVSEEEILGEVVEIKAGAGVKLIWLQSRGWIYLCGIGLLLTAGSLFFKNGKEEE